MSDFVASVVVGGLSERVLTFPQLPSGKIKVQPCHTTGGSHQFGQYSQLPLPQKSQIEMEAQTNSAFDLSTRLSSAHPAGLSTW